MARRIEFLAPVEAMRGNLSGKQVLKYPTKNNTAWDAPSDKRSYAINYNSRYVGAKRSADGKKYFAVKQRAAVTNTPEQREAQALLAGSKIIADAMLKDISIIARLALMLKGYVHSGLNYNPAFIPSDIVPGHPNNSLRRYLMRNIRELTLIPKNKQFVVQPQSGPDIVYNNPWRNGQTSGTKVTGITDMFEKFWIQLTPAYNNMPPCYFYVAGRLGLAYGTNFGWDEYENRIPDSLNYNVNTLGVTHSAIDGDNYMMLDGQYIIDDDGYITDGMTIKPDYNYHLTDIAPSA